MKGNVYPDRAAWLVARGAPGTIGASEAASILGISPYRGPWEVWQSKMELRPEVRTELPQQTRGHRWEKRVLEDYATDAGVQLVDPAAHLRGRGLAILHHEQHDWLRCSPDSFAMDRRTLGGAEAKTDTHTSHWTPELGLVVERWEEGCETLVPPYYAVQVYLSLEISGLPWWDLCALVPAGGWLEVRWVRFHRDPETQDSLVATLSEWRERHLVAGNPPPVDGSSSCNQYLARSFQKKETRDAHFNEASALMDLYQLRRHASAIEEDIKVRSNRLIEMANGCRLNLPNGGYAQPQHNKGRVTLDAKIVAAEAPELFARASKQSAPFVSLNFYRMDKDNGI